MQAIRLFILVALVLFSSHAYSQICDATLSAGSPANAIQAALDSPLYENICLLPGVYYFASTIEVRSGKKLKGLGASRSDVAINTSASRGFRMHDYSEIENISIYSGPPGSVSFGVLIYHKVGVRIVSISIAYADINVGIVGSNDVRILDSFMYYPGSRSGPEPNIWIDNSQNISVRYGASYGSGIGPGGDGEVAAHRSTNVLIEGHHIIDSGASGLYFVNCDYCTANNVTILRSREWGFDIVDGSDYVLVTNSTAKDSWFGGAVFYEFDSVGGEFYNNSFIDNAQTPWVTPCNGINIRGVAAGVIQSGNFASPLPVLCVISPGPP